MGIRSYGCAAARENLATRGRREKSAEGRRGGMFLKDEGEQGTATERGEQPNATELEPSRDVSKQVPPDPLNRICQLDTTLPPGRKMLPNQSIHLTFLFLDLS